MYLRRISGKVTATPVWEPEQGKSTTLGYQYPNHIPPTEANRKQFLLQSSTPLILTNSLTRTSRIISRKYCLEY